MPFASEAQRRWMLAAESRGEVPPGTYDRWAAETPPGRLPERAAKRNGADAVQLAMAAAVGVGAMGGIARSLHAEMRAKRLDAEVLRSLAPWGLGPETRIAAPRNGVYSTAPRLRDLADRAAVSTAWDGRKRELLAQAASGDVRVVLDTGGAPCIAPPVGAPQPFILERSRRFQVKRNDAAAASGYLWATAQYDDASYGSWGAAVRHDGHAQVYAYDGASWQRVADARWNGRRGRLDGAPPGDVPPAVASGLAASLLAEPAVRSILKAHLKDAVTAAFHGRGGPPPPLSGAADVAVRAVAAARCAEKGARRSSMATKAGRARREKSEAQTLVVRYALADVCGRDIAPIAQGSPCDAALSAIESAGEEAACSLEAPSCPRRTTPEVMSERRGGDIAPIGPYETDRPHAVGTDPCCYYHPTTQARMRLRRQVERAENVHEGDPRWLEAVRSAEAAHELAEVWRKCDEDALKRAGGFLDSGKGSGSGGSMKMLRAFYEAARRQESNAARATFRRLQDELGVSADFDDFSALDAAFFDVAHRTAHDSKNIGYINWVHGAMKRHGVAIHHAKR